MIDLHQQRVLIIGLGKSGLAASRLLSRLGAEVTVTDEASKKTLAEQLRLLPNNVRLALGTRKISSDGFDLLIVSPGVPWGHPSLVSARKKGIPVWPELELAWRCVQPQKTVAVTGTNGKTTTTALIGHLLHVAKKKVLVGGNIGTPLSELVSRITGQTSLVLEVSSYQLEGHETFHPNVGVILNVTPDHLKRHGTMANYAKAKGRLFARMNSQDVAVYNRKDGWCRKIAESSRATKVGFPSKPLMKLALNIRLRGAHNLENAMAAAASVKALGLSEAVIKEGLRSFKGVPHRIEFVATKNGVTYVNDSKATNVDSTLVAIKSFKEPLILLMGGEHKGSPYTPLAPYVKDHVKLIVAYGESKKLIERDLKRAAPILIRSDLKAALRAAREQAKRGDVVLLSPACASFDQYKNFEHRGDIFRNLVRAL